MFRCLQLSDDDSEETDAENNKSWLQNNRDSENKSEIMKRMKWTIKDRRRMLEEVKDGISYTAADIINAYPAFMDMPGLVI